MKTLEQVMQTVANFHEADDFDDLFHGADYTSQLKFISLVSREFAYEVAKEALKNASNNAETIITGEGIMDHEVDKQSILSLKNIPEL